MRELAFPRDCSSAVDDARRLLQRRIGLDPQLARARARNPLMAQARDGIEARVRTAVAGAFLGRHTTGRPGERASSGSGECDRRPRLWPAEPRGERIVAIGILRPESTQIAKHLSASLRRWRITSRAVTPPTSSLCANSDDAESALEAGASVGALAQNLASAAGPDKLGLLAGRRPVS